MDTATEAVLQAIIKSLIQMGQNEAVAHAITQNLYAASEELLAAAMPAEGTDVERLADFARDCIISK